MSSPAVFLDRDGTLIEDVGHLDRLERLRPFPWSADAVRLLKRAGYAVVVITNQGGVALGIIDEHVVVDVYRALQDLFGADGQMDGHHYCPHLADAPLAAYRLDCDCRKPRPGLIRRAAAELDLDLHRSIVIGDRWSDMRVGTAVGARTAMVRTGYGATQARRPPDGAGADAVVDNLMEAVSWVLRQT